MQHAEPEQSAKERHDVTNLGHRLFSDRRGDLRDYPHDRPETEWDDRTSRPGTPDDPDDPEHILIDLSTTIDGCRWQLVEPQPLSPLLPWNWLACALATSEPNPEDVIRRKFRAEQYWDSAN